MKALDVIKNGARRWLDQVAEAVVAAIGRFGTRRTLRLLEGERGRFVAIPSHGRRNARSEAVEVALEGDVGRLPAALDEMARGGRIEVVLRSDRFVFKPLDLPSRAAEFLDGVVRAQIDRLTPWNADSAAFGVSAPVEAGAGRIVVTVAATAKTVLAPIVQAVSSLGPRSITICARVADAAPDAPIITVMERNVAGFLDVHRVRRLLLAVLAVAVVGATAANVAAMIIGSDLQARQDDLARRIAARRAAAMSALHAPGDPRSLAERALAQRKSESPAAVIVLEILSQIVPDTSYVTELHIEANKVRLSGVTLDAPELIRLIEQTHHFSQAIFFAPITRAPSEHGDHFNIEARMEPDFSLTP